MAKSGYLALLRQQLTSFCYHIHTVYLMCSNNIWDIIIGGFLFGTINSFAAPCISMGPALTSAQVLAAAPSMLLWSCSNLFLFCLHNQRQPGNMAEDVLNKPWRPLVSGRLTPDQAVRLLYLMHPLCLAIAIHVGGFAPYAVLTFFHVWYNEFGAASNGLLKNLFNGVGVGCFFAGPLEVATRRSVLAGDAQAALWVGLLMAAVATTSHVQDFRDMRGDRAAGRCTVPLMMDEMAARVVAVVGAGGWTELACRFWAAGRLQSAAPWAAATLMMANLLLDRNHAGDVRAWQLWSVWVLGLVLLPIFSVSA